MLPQEFNCIIPAKSVSEKVAVGFPACQFSGFQPQVGWRTGGKMPPSLATKMVAATFSDSLSRTIIQI